MKNPKKRSINNLINGLVAGALLFGCSCTLCNKRYYVNFILPRAEAASGKKERSTPPAQNENTSPKEFFEK
ncbi:MAG TPA: hypothetical protein VGC97_05535 [Pyrinomonadaceae bacterium]|jgi:hypothetical protein